MPFYEFRSSDSCSQDEEYVDVIRKLEEKGSVRRLRRGWNEGPESPLLSINTLVDENGALIRVSQRSRTIDIADMVTVTKLDNNTVSTKKGGDQITLRRKKGSIFTVVYPINFDEEVKLVTTWYETPLMSLRRWSLRHLSRLDTKLKRKLLSITDAKSE